VGKIDAKLFEKVQKKLELSRAALYERIKKRANVDSLTNDVALLAIAADNGMGIQRHATAEQLAMRRGAAPKSTPPTVVHVAAPRVVRQKGGSVAKKVPKKKENSVFVVHGRDENIRKSMFLFLRSIGLNPMEWVKAIELTGKGSPHVSEILDAAFAHAQAIVILLTPDDEAQLRSHFQKTHDPGYEKTLTGQARPNVIFEAGLAFGRNENGTVLVEMGTMRPFSDIGGMHTVRLSNNTESRAQLATKLRNAGCTPDTNGTEWHSVGDFTLTAPPPEPKKKKKKKK
jgi:predicted nucleotide-binding protein